MFMNDLHIKVLLVDNQAASRQAAQALLSTWPELKIVGHAADAQSAVAQCAALRPDVVLMGIKMPLTPDGSKASAELGGLQAMQEIKARWPTTLIIAFTMYGNLSEAATAAGADAFLLKGDDPIQLTSVVDRIVRAGRLQAMPHLLGEPQV